MINSLFSLFDFHSTKDLLNYTDQSSQLFIQSQHWLVLIPINLWIFREYPYLETILILTQFLLFYLCFSYFFQLFRSCFSYNYLFLFTTSSNCFLYFISIYYIYGSNYWISDAFFSLSLSFSFSLSYFSLSFINFNY